MAYVRSGWGDPAGDVVVSLHAPPRAHLGRFQSHAGGVDRVGIDDPQVGVGDDDAVGRLLDRGRQAVALAARLGVGQGSMDGRNEGSQATLRDVRPGAVAQCLDD